MVKKCNNCGNPIVDNPMFIMDNKAIVGKDAWKKILKGDFKGFRWQTLFSFDWLSIAFVVIVLILAFQYKHDIGKCNEIINDSCSWSIKQAEVCGYTVITHKPLNNINNNSNIFRRLI